MSQGCSSSQIRCHCGMIASRITSTIVSNPRRKLYKCPKPKIYSCGYSEWEDEVYPNLPINVIQELGVVKLDNEKLKQEVAAMEVTNHSQVVKVSTLEEKVSKMSLLLLISSALFIGFIAASMTK
nr:uncharacterized protein LOC104091252 [Nicotiana tomentosiformis]